MTSILAQKISHLPERFAAGDCSTAELLEESGYLDAPEALKVSDVEEALRQEPELADHWLERGHDQRLAGGWGIECDGERYRVQCFGGGPALVETNRLHATAEFIVRYVGTIADVVRRYEER